MRTSGILPQRWTLRLIVFDGDHVQVVAPAVDSQGRAEMQITEGQRAILIVSGVTPGTTEPASYSIDVSIP